ncbi:phosphate acyltransferase PlsX [Flavobacteriales bacterium]|nr:phosphate acyltransferase PlsX [Flavobacteriales bacterium]
MRIGIDIMGGDYAPQKTVHGAILALNELPSDTKIVLFGRESEILTELKKYNINANNFEIIDCTDVIDMGEHPTKAFKSKPNSSIAKGFEYLAKGKIDGFASAGNTGAMFVGGYYSVKAITGVLRPAISTLIPREDGGVTVLLDVGANADCKPDVLYQFGILGSLFSEYVCGIKSPKVSLLNLGEEKTKGNMLTQATYSMMEKNSDYNFIGNIEGRDIFDSQTDVIVCDGFTGNIVLKEAEGIYSIMEKRGLLDDYFKRFNYENYGGTPILGLNKTVIIGHGISNEIAIKNMITLTKDVAEADLRSKIKNELN